MSLCQGEIGKFSFSIHHGSPHGNGEEKKSSQSREGLVTTSLLEFQVQLPDNSDLARRWSLF